jgi:hypothetical protein
MAISFATQSYIAPDELLEPFTKYIVAPTVSVSDHKARLSVLFMAVLKFDVKLPDDKVMPSLKVFTLGIKCE